ncbi:Hypothetical protein PHPALM_3502 [Phytophthora palmivora]|uniref:CCHC-type domain-containing protein n=1 Tax=Phytophthora palmivora TaxID=4796 RepID=A0A2P4YM99_9STRA|nr:Hypothetical protein PHPALM_3502 [Phytophthora palmivora]
MDRDSTSALWHSTTYCITYKQPIHRNTDNRACYFCKKPGHIKADCFSWEKSENKRENDQPRQ